MEGVFDLPAGEFVEVEITNSDAYDLYAKLVD
jgi:tRNA A37 methylthiotransferase MiaB